MQLSARLPRPRSVLAVTTAAVCAAALAVAPASADTDGAGDRPNRGLPRLKGTVGPDFTISISDDSVPAGRYKLIVKDEGTIHNFHIKGAGVDRKTSVPDTGKVVWKVTLSQGTYKIKCDPHESMETELVVT